MAEELDEVTLRACRRGDRAAFRALVHCYQDRVYALCVALAGSEAEDLAQETFVRVHDHVARFDPAGPATLGGWILTIARRLCIDRARVRRRREELTEALPEPGWDEPLDARLERAEEARAVRRAIAALPFEQRAVLALRLWDGLDYQQIAAVEEVPVGTVRSRLARAKQALRQALGGEPAVGEEDAHGG